MTCPHCTDADTDNPMVLKLRLSELRRERDHYRDCISAREVRRIVDERDALRALLREAQGNMREFAYTSDLDSRIDAAIAGSKG
jgi:hypothetical protein